MFEYKIDFVQEHINWIGFFYHCYTVYIFMYPVYVSCNDYSFFVLIYIIKSGIDKHNISLLGQIKISMFNFF